MSILKVNNYHVDTKGQVLSCWYQYSITFMLKLNVDSYHIDINVHKYHVDI